MTIIYLTTSRNYYNSRSTLGTLSMVHEAPDKVVRCLKLNWSCWRSGRLAEHIFQSYLWRWVHIYIVTFAPSI